MSVEKEDSPLGEAAANLERLSLNPYPGRGIVMGINSTGKLGVQVYWIMGRSENSRNRILAREGDVVKTVPFDESKVKDPSLIIYNAMKVVHGKHIVSNGNQTDTIVETIQKWGSFEGALKTRSFEPDAPNFTPRISGILDAFFIKFTLSRIAVDSNASSAPRHDFFNLDRSTGIGHCIHTYKGDGDPLPSFYENPYPVPLSGNIDDIARTYWEALNKQNRVALVAKTIRFSTGETDFRIINQLSKK